MVGPDILSQIQHGVSELHQEQCNQCGKCSSGCPAARFLSLRPRKIVAMAQRDLIEELIESKVIWECAQCLQCTERCPREVTPFDIIIACQNLAVSKGLQFPEGLTRMLSSVKRLGAIQPPQEIIDREFEAYDRESLDLPDAKRPRDMAKFLLALEKVLGEG